MKYTLSALVGLLFLVACERPPQLVLEGTLGKRFTSKFVLQQNGDRFDGYFTYLENPEEQIAVAGTKAGNTLRLEEFNNDEQKLTGIFEGKYDGETFSGFWTDPSGKSKVPFEYMIIQAERPVTSSQKDGIDVMYEAVAQDEWVAEFFHGLNATANGEKYTIFEQDESFCFNIVDIRDYDGNGIDDALLVWFPTCDGNGQPMKTLYFCTYLPSDNRFVLTDEFGSLNPNDAPEIRKEGNIYTVAFTSLSAYHMYRAYEKYTLREGKAVRIEYNEVNPMPALAEIRAEDFTEHEKRYGKSMKFDLNGDGELETIQTDYWSRWRMIGWDIQFSSGQEIKGESSCFRIGVLASKTKGYHDLVYGLDEVLVWDGKRYVEKN